MKDLESARLEIFELMQSISRRPLLPPRPIKGLTPNETAVLLHITKSKKNDRNRPVRPGQIAHAMQVTPSALSQVLKTLESKGYVLRTRENDDNRLVAVELSKTGKEIARKVDKEWTRRFEILVEEVGIEDLLTLMRILDHVSRVLSKIDGMESGLFEMTMTDIDALVDFDDGEVPEGDEGEAVPAVPPKPVIPESLVTPIYEDIEDLEGYELVTPDENYLEEVYGDDQGERTYIA
ncbi:MAG: MarR family transcriptional regulator [Eggerthellaceae bacterium]|nr:MarR family transcriptional regulator [Eggerthellaceae bacterium]